MMPPLPLPERPGKALMYAIFLTGPRTTRSSIDQYLSSDNPSTAQHSNRQPDDGIPSSQDTMFPKKTAPSS